ncbi:Aste57867_20817 [Aphanomyces stellatus]|uniref:Aste57867_20817 protein n=1 Tax=Aphanomyces stellatus TaxID=120398 RepID=A0A485LH58_9STRA|nr:hypothetical protein As57867_020749 [Aphanomyces stellatus]VFT97496.1 Aste57867_20817 [Aphanomyces stellatus]
MQRRDSLHPKRRLQSATSAPPATSTTASSLSTGAIIGIAVAAVVLLVVVAYIFVRRSRLETRRKQMQIRVDRAMLEGSTQQQNGGLGEQLLAPPMHHLNPPPPPPPHEPMMHQPLPPTMMKPSDIGMNPTPIEHVVIGSAESDDFVIMGAAGAKGSMPDFSKFNKAGMNMKASAVKLGGKPGLDHYEPHGSAPGPSSFASSYVSDDIAMLQSTRGESFDVVPVVEPKPSKGRRHL